MAASTAVITGATSGIGAAFARRLARDGANLVVVARDQARLERLSQQLRAQHGVAVEPIPADLAAAEGREEVARRLADPRRPVDLLVNSAGMSLNTPFLRSTPAMQTLLLELNVHAVMRLTHAVLPGMVARQAGAVVNVSSVAGFAAVMPGSTYPATKAWVTNFTESVALSVTRHGVRVMVLCPGYVRTEFHERAGIDRVAVPGWMWLDADTVADVALRDLDRGRLVSVPGGTYKLAAFALRHLPRAVLVRAARGTRRRLGRADPPG